MTAVVALTFAGLLPSNCSANNTPTSTNTPSPSPPPDGSGSTSSFEEANSKLPLNGTESTRILWDIEPADTTDEVLAAQRSQAFHLWLYQAGDWRQIIPVGRLLFTPSYYDYVLAPRAKVADARDRRSGIIWVKLMEAEKINSTQARVSFCSDLSWFHRDSEEKTKVAEDQSDFDTFLMERSRDPAGGERWLADTRILASTPGATPAFKDQDALIEKCKKWAQHKRP